MKKSLGAQTLLYPSPAVAVGSYDTAGKPNVMAAAWVGLCSSRPPAVTVGIREACHTHAGIVEHQAFTLGIVPEHLVAELDYFGLASGAREDKFDVSGLTAVKSELVNAPYVTEFPVIVECTLLKTFRVGIHTQFVGEILDVKADESVLDEEGRPDVDKVQPICFIPDIREYRGLGKRLAKAFSCGREVRRRKQGQDAEATDS